MEKSERGATTIVDPCEMREASEAMSFRSDRPETEERKRASEKTDVLEIVGDVCTR